MEISDGVTKPVKSTHPQFLRGGGISLYSHKT